jgi:hypothetical protein
LVDGESVSVSFADSSAETTTFTMEAGSTTIEAVYAQATAVYCVTITNGKVNGSSDEQWFEEGTEITVEADPNPYGQQFANWVVNDGAYDLGSNAKNSSITVTVSENLDFRAVYEGVQYSVTVSSGTSNYSKCVSGTVVKISADEAPYGMEFDYWYVDTNNVSLANASSTNTTFTMPEGDVKVTAHYKKVAYQVSVENGSSDQTYYYAGDVVTITSNYPASGREFSQWTSVSGNVQFGDSSRYKTTFTMPASNVKVKATYKDGPSTNDNVILEIENGGTYYTSDTIKFQASGAGMSNSNPNPGDYRYRPSGYQIGSVTKTWSSSPYTSSMAIKAAGEYTLKVVFNKDIYDGSNWVSEGTTDTKSVTFTVNTGTGSVLTGDSTPFEIVIAVAGVALVLFIIVLVVFIVRKRRK